MILLFKQQEIKMFILIRIVIFNNKNAGTQINQIQLIYRDHQDKMTELVVWNL